MAARSLRHLTGDATLVCSAYFIHEFAHQTIFRSAQANARWGLLMGWLNGSCFARFDDLRRKHMRHHLERADVLTFDAKGFLLRSPAWLRRTVVALEWAYFPAVEYLMRAFVILMPFRAGGTASARLRIVAIALLRLAALALLAIASPKALLLYCLAVLIFITVLRFADCFQHTYDAYPILDDRPLPQDKIRDRDYGQAHTFTDVAGVSDAWGHALLNMVWLNFGFHNAHHERPTVPWHRLPAYHRTLYRPDHAQVMTVGELLHSFHANRIRRIFAQDYGQVGPFGTPGRADRFVGAVGVSFLTAV